QIYNRKKLRILAQRIGPVLCFTRKALKQIQITRRIFIGLPFADNSFSQKIDSKANFLGTTLAQCPHYIVRISSGDELACHFGNVPAQDGPTDPWNNARKTNASPQKFRNLSRIMRIGEV